MRIYVDSDYCCHSERTSESDREFEVDFFDTKCAVFIEGYRYIPTNESWTRSDGTTFQGEMIAPYKDFAELDSAQRQYEVEKLADAENALAILLGGVSE